MEVNDAVDAIKRRVRGAAQAMVNELAISHGIENVSVAVSETAQSITVKMKISSVASPEGDIDDSAETE